MESFSILIHKRYLGSLPSISTFSEWFETDLLSPQSVIPTCLASWILTEPHPKPLCLPQSPKTGQTPNQEHLGLERQDQAGIISSLKILFATFTLSPTNAQSIKAIHGHRKRCRSSPGRWLNMSTLAQSITQAAVWHHPLRSLGLQIPREGKLPPAPQRFALRTPSTAAATVLYLLHFFFFV